MYFLQNLYRSAPEGMGAKWDPDEDATELVISDQKPVLTAVEKKPHIICVLGDCQWAGLSLDQLQAEKIMRHPSRTHTDLVSMTVAYHCQAREGLHARRLAWWSSYFTNVYRRLIMKEGHIHQVATNHRISAESSPQAYTGATPHSEIVTSIVTVPFYWQPQWRIKDISAVVFRQVKFTMHVSKPEPIFSAGNAGRLRGARIHGKELYPLPLAPKPSTFEQVVVDTASTDEEE